MRLDGSTKIEDRQYITERFNADAKIFAFIASSRSGGVGIKYVFCVCWLRRCTLTLHSLTGADTVVFYDSDFNPQMDRQCEDRLASILICYSKKMN
jgi:helicase SWR1